MRNLSRNTRKNKRKNKGKAKNRVLSNSTKMKISYTSFKTILKKSDSDKNAQLIWINKNIKPLVFEHKAKKSDFIVIVYDEEKNLTPYVGHLKLNEVEKVFNGDGLELGKTITEYVENNKCDDIIVFFIGINLEFNSFHLELEVTKNEVVDITTNYCQKIGDSIKIDFLLLQQEFNLDDEDIIQLKKLEYFPKYEKIQDLQGKFRELDPILVGLYDFTQGNILMLEKTKGEGFKNTHFVLDENGNLVNLFDPERLLKNIKLGKSIFKKIDSKAFVYFFEEDNNSQKSN